jgi:hypothetical protein
MPTVRSPPMEVQLDALGLAHPMPHMWSEGEGLVVGRRRPELTIRFGFGTERSYRTSPEERRPARPNATPRRDPSEPATC